VPHKISLFSNTFSGINGKQKELVRKVACQYWRNLINLILLSAMPAITVGIKAFLDVKILNCSSTAISITSILAASPLIPIVHSSSHFKKETGLNFLHHFIEGAHFRCVQSTRESIKLQLSHFQLNDKENVMPHSSQLNYN
jgi:hypothetical protein